MNEGTHVIGGPLHICENCDRRHYDNCPTCFGFGLHGPGTVGSSKGPHPISAGSMASDWIPCPTCKSTPRGIPEAVVG